MAFEIVVPPHQHAAIEELTSLSEDAYKAVYECLARTGPLAEPTALIKQTSKALSDYTKLGGQVLGMVIGLRSLVDRSAMAQTDVVDAVATDVVGKKWVAQESRGPLCRKAFRTTGDESHSDFIEGFQFSGSRQFAF